MAYKRKLKRIVRRRNYRRRKTYKKRQFTTIAKFGSQGLPKKIQTKLNYTLFGSLTSTSGSIAYQLFRCNSLYDPDQTGAGAQPYMRDTWASLYYYYRVYACSIRVRASTDSGVDSYVTIRPTLSSLPIGSMVLEAERGGSTTVVTPNKPGYIKRYISIAKEFGVSRKDVAIEDNYSAASGSNPVNQLYVAVASQPMDQATTSTVNLVATIKYYCEWFGFIDQAQS